MLPLALHCHRGLDAAMRLAGCEAEAESELAAALALGKKLGIEEPEVKFATTRPSL
jgi:hypothetical protein